MTDPITQNEPARTPFAEGRNSAQTKPLRIWPAISLVGLMLAARFGPLLAEGGTSRYWMIAVFGPLLCCILLLIWWVTFSRATWKERLFGFLGLGSGLAATLLLVDPSMRGPGTSYLTLPMGMFAFALAAVFVAKSPPITRSGTAVLFAIFGFGFSILLRNEGMTGDYQMTTHWRWSTTQEERMLAARATRTTDAKISTAPEKGNIRSTLANPEWPGFRGADRAGRFSGARLSTNWAASPPRQLWKIPVGPAWSSFAVAGNLLFTQEQRGQMETIVSYDADTGRELWKREIEGRFDDPLGGPGPRATPTLATNGLFVTGAFGAVLRLNPQTGEIDWRQDLTTLTGKAVPMWGFSASPLVVKDVVIIYGGGSAEKSLFAFDAASGTLRWAAAAGSDSYSSPQLNLIAGDEVVLLLSNRGLVVVDPYSGRQRLDYEWNFSQYRALQPHFIDDMILLPTGMNMGTRAIRVTKSNDQMLVQELWTSRHLKPDFTDLVTYQGYAYGNDAGIWTCIDLKTGERKWKGGRYGKGQALLLEKSDALLIAAENGDVVLVGATPQEYVELASFKALEGKTWNHPVVVGDRLYVRNAQEAAAYQLPLEDTKRSEP